MVDKVKKRNGEVVDYNISKVTQAIFAAAESVGGSDMETAEFLSGEVSKSVNKNLTNVEEVQDIIEKVLIEHGHAKTAKAFILYRSKKMEERLGQDVDIPIKIKEMFEHQSKLSKLVNASRIESYKNTYLMLKKMQAKGELPVHDDYLGGSELARNIYHKKYCLKDLDGNLIEKTPEEVFTRLAAYISSVETDDDKRIEYAQRFYKDLYNGSYLPGGRVIAGAGDLYRLKTLANCFVTLIKEDNIESIYNAAYDAARTYSYGGGIGIDISNLRPKDSVVHNAADMSTGAVSFMELYSLTTGLIGQSGRRGALMLTLDVKHPDILDFIKVKNVPNWVTEQIVKQCEWSNKFNEDQLDEIQKQVRENTQVRFANISIKVSDEFMQSVNEQTLYGKDKVLLYKKQREEYEEIKQGENLHYSYGMPSKDLGKYELIKDFVDVSEASNYLKDNYSTEINEGQLSDQSKRDVYGDYIIKIDNAEHDLAVRQSGDYMLYYNSDNTGELKNLIKARDVWNLFVKGNYKTAEPGLIFWSTMIKYSPSNYVGRKISSTNPCGEVPLEDGGACNLGSINLSRFVKNGYTEDAEVDWDGIGQAARNLTRFLDNVITWNHALNPLEKQRKAAEETRRIGLGYMGIADMLNQLGVGYDSEDGLNLMKKVSRFIANVSYEASAELAQEKGPCGCFKLDDYIKCPFLSEALEEHVQEKVRKYGVRNVAVLSIAPTGTISNAILGFNIGNKNYVGVSGGVEPIFALYYTRRSESFNKFFKVFHSTVQAYIDLKKLNETAQKATDEKDLHGILPEYFFRTAHHISPENRVEVQGICQSNIDHSISSTVNLSEDINPEIISKIYLDAWKKGLKGITIYRDGSRYPILSVASQKTAFQGFRDKKFEVEISGEKNVVKGDTVVELPSGTLTTAYHLLKHPVEGISVSEVVEDVKIVGGGNSGLIVETDAAKGHEVKHGVLDEQSSSIKLTSGVVGETSIPTGASNGVNSVGSSGVSAGVSGVVGASQMVASVDGFVNSSDNLVENPCPECGGGMRMTEGCATCPECGHSPCSIKL